MLGGSLSTRDKIGQLFLIGFTGTSVTPDLASFLKEYKPGGVILFSRNLESVDQIVQLTNDLQRSSPHSPLLIAVDQEGGRVSRLPKRFTIFPPCDVLGRCNSTELAYAAAATIAKELRVVGINMNMAPVLDVNSNPDNPVIGDRAFGSNADSHKELPIVEVPRERLDLIELPPFRHAVAQGVASVMTAHVLYRALDEKLPATLSSMIITDLLRHNMRYDGMVLTDDLEMHAIIDHYGIEDAAVRAVLAGCDVLLICKDRDREVAAFTAIEQAVASGIISIERLNLSVARIARIKERFVTPYKQALISDAKLIVGCRTHQALLHSIQQAQGRHEQQAASTEA